MWAYKNPPKRVFESRQGRWARHITWRQRLLAQGQQAQQEPMHRLRVPQRLLRVQRGQPFCF